MKPIRKIIPMLCATPNINDEKGDYNGYLAIPSELFNKLILPKDEDEYCFVPDYDRMPNIGVYPHGSWTYCENADLNNLKHFIPLLDIRKVDTKNYTIIGFDTCHLDDNSDIWNAKTVREHVFELYDALIDYIKTNKVYKKS